MGTATRQTGLTIRLRGRIHHPPRPCPVERGAARVARHVRERLPELIPGHQPGAISGFYLMVQRVPVNAGERETLCRENRQSRAAQSGCAAIKERCKSPRGTWTKAARPIGCKARQVRGTRAGVGSLPVATPRSRNLTRSGVPPKTRTVKSSTMKGASSPCQSAAAETEPNRERSDQDG